MNPFFTKFKFKFKNKIDEVHEFVFNFIFKIRIYVKSSQFMLETFGWKDGFFLN